MAQSKREMVANGSAVKAVPFPNLPSNRAIKNYINAVYDASAAARTAQLEAAYKRGEADLKAAQTAAKAAYGSQMRQTDARAQQADASFRQIAKAQGVNTGAGGQADLIRGNQAQNNLRTLGQSYMNTNMAIERQKAALARDRDYEEQRIIANNELNRNKALYEESVRADQLALQEAQTSRQQSTQMLQKQMNKVIAQKQEEAKAAAAAAMGKKQTINELAAEFWINVCGGKEAVGEAINKSIEEAGGVTRPIEDYTAMSYELLFALLQSEALNAGE